MRTLILAVGILAIVGMVYCQAAEHPGAALVTKVTGTVSKIDTAKNEVSVKSATGTEKVLAVGTTVKITKSGKTITLADLKVGDKITAEEEAGKAKSIDVEAAIVLPAAPERK